MREEPSSDWERDSKMAAVVIGMGQVLIVCGVPGTQDFTRNGAERPACVTASSWADAHAYKPLLAA